MIVDGLRSKTTFYGRRPLMEEDLGWKTTLDRRRPLTEDNLWRKMIFCGRGPLVEVAPLWKTAFNGRRLLIEIFWVSTLQYTAVAGIFMLSRILGVPASHTARNWRDYDSWSKTVCNGVEVFRRDKQFPYIRLNHFEFRALICTFILIPLPHWAKIGGHMGIQMCHFISFWAR